MLLFVDVMGESVLLYLSEQIIIFQSQGGSFYQSIRGESCQMLTNKRPRKMLPPIRSRKRRQLTNERTGQSEQTIISGQQRARTQGTRGGEDINTGGGQHVGEIQTKWGISFIN